MVILRTFSRRQHLICGKIGQPKSITCPNKKLLLIKISIFHDIPNEILQIGDWLD